MFTTGSGESILITICPADVTSFCEAGIGTLLVLISSAFLKPDPSSYTQ
jgi:hypothetical protein